MHFQTEQKVALYCCNNAKKYWQLKKLVYADRLRIEYIMTYICEENKLAKRFNCIIIEMIKAMLT